jgi:hypothetical protein
LTRVENLPLLYKLSLTAKGRPFRLSFIRDRIFLAEGNINVH